MRRRSAAMASRARVCAFSFASRASRAARHWSGVTMSGLAVLIGPPDVVGRASRGPQPDERSRPAVLDIEQSFALRPLRDPPGEYVGVMQRIAGAGVQLAVHD